jgi:hypothetical protein
MIWALASILLTAALGQSSTVRGGELFRDDFSGFPAGWLTRPVGQLNGAIQEYDYLPHRGVPLGRWANAICHLDAWPSVTRASRTSNSTRSTTCPG